ncbi:MAG: transcription elongation factor GreA [Atopobium sp.]|nr:transcription elongation factor GreA [Atopobium sp.]
MAKKEMTLTPEGRQKLVDELQYLEGEKSAEIIEAIKEARAQGDLSENAEYDAAKEEQAKNAARINEIRQILSTARVVEAGAGELSVSLGCTVQFADDKGRKTAYTIVGTTETNSLENRISNESPVGSAAIGHVVGDKISYATPAGKTRSLTITNITR